MNKRYPEIFKASGYDYRTHRGGDEYQFPNGCYRLPSVLELERMMTFPDGYVSSIPNVSRTQKQKALGLSFTVDVITHLLKF
jgi:DNA (cytosine-5)-methyltransferase 3A